MITDTTTDCTKERDNWIELVSSLIDDIEGWCGKLGWSASRASKKTSEEYIGTYEVPCLTIHTPSGRIHIDPMGVNIIGAEGRIDILAYPSMNRLFLMRKNSRWSLFTESRVQWPQEWGETAFKEIVQSLAV